MIKYKVDQHCNNEANTKKENKLSCVVNYFKPLVNPKERNDTKNVSYWIFDKQADHWEQ